MPIVILYKGKSLIEVLIVLVITIIILSSYWFHSFFDNTAKNKNLLKLKQLQQGLYFARAEAIRLQEKVYICPSYNLKECCYNWSERIIIFTPGKDNLHTGDLQKGNFTLLNYLKPIFHDKNLRFKFFGNQNKQKITFLPNGTTINNGHFCTSYNNSYGFACLYINQTGRSYIITTRNL